MFEENFEKKDCETSRKILSNYGYFLRKFDKS